MKIRIKSLETTEGYLQNAPVSFADGLTCIIGARGTCKSTIVETIRFLYTHASDDLATDINDNVGESTRGLLKATLGTGTARCLAHAVDASAHVSELRLERTIDSQRTRIYRDDVLDTSPDELRLEVYSQGELVKIAENPEHRLKLIDRPHASQIRQLQAQVRSLQSQVTELGMRILSLRIELQEDAQTLSPLRELETQLTEVRRERPTLGPEIELERGQYEIRERLLSRSRTTLQSFASLFSSLLPSFPTAESVLALTEELEEINAKPASDLAKGLRSLSSIANQLQERQAAANVLATELHASIAALRQVFDEHNQRYRDLRRDQQALSAGLEREDRIVNQIRQLQQVAVESEHRERLLHELLQQRMNLRRGIEEHLDQIFQLRLSEISRIERDVGHEVTLQIVQGAQSRTLIESLVEIMQGTRLKRQRDIAERIAELLSPADFVDIIEQGDTARLARIASLDDGQASRIINHCQDSMQKTLNLETIVPDDQLRINMNVDGEARPIEKLSRGQMATALLPLILRPADYPLLFDQPEDDLDNRFIFKHLVSRIKELKTQRQLVFVTHNANIPVLGGADQVVVMTMENASLANVPEQGSVDQMRQPIIDLLEGGLTAFEERRRRYAKATEKTNA